MLGKKSQSIKGEKRVGPKDPGKSEEPSTLSLGEGGRALAPNFPFGRRGPTGVVNLPGAWGIQISLAMGKYWGKIQFATGRHDQLRGRGTIQ